MCAVIENSVEVSVISLHFLKLWFRWVSF